MLSNADRQLPEQDVYELAASFSDVLEQELLHYTGLNADGSANGDGSLGYFINNTYVRKGGIKNVYGEDTDHTFTLQAPAGVDELTVTLRKTLSEAYGETADESTSDSNILISYDIASNTDLQNLSEVMKSREQSYKENGLADYDITVTLKTTKAGVQAPVCVLQMRQVRKKAFTPTVTPPCTCATISRTAHPTTAPSPASPRTTKEDRE